MNEKTLKGLVHVTLFGLALYEALRSDSKTRKFVNGAAAGWHLHASVYHFIYEKEVDN